MSQFFDKYDDRLWFFTTKPAIGAALDRRGALFAKYMPQGKEGLTEFFKTVSNNFIAASKTPGVIHSDALDFIACVRDHHKNTLQTTLMSEVVPKWSTLNDETKAFYRNYVIVDLTAGGSVPLDAVTPTSGVQKIRVTPAFNDVLPSEMLTVYTDSNSPPAHSCATPTADGGVIKFGINVDNYVRSRMFAIAKAAIKEEPDETEYKEVLDCVSGNIISRDEKGNLQMMRNGKIESIDRKAQSTFEMIKFANQCYGYGLPNNDDRCNILISQCLLNNDDTQLTAGLKSLLGTDFFKKSTDQIKDLHPVLACRLLQRLGFRKYLDRDDSIAGRPIWKVESVDHWLKSKMASKFTDDVLQGLINNNETNGLLRYLNLVSQYVNCNPAILNPGTNVRTMEGVGAYRVDSDTKRMGIKAQMPIPNDGTSCYRDDLHRLGVMRAQKFPVLPIALNPTMGPFSNAITPMSMLATGARFGMAGGGCQNNAVIRDLYNRCSGSKILKDYLHALIETVESQGKALDPKDKAKIHERINQLQDIETELIRTICYMDEYIKITDVFADDYASDTLNRGHLQTFTNRYRYMLDKQQNAETSLSDVMTRLLGAIAGPQEKYVDL